MMSVFNVLNEFQHVLIKPKNQIFFKTSIFWFTSHIHNICIFTSLSLIFLKPFHFLVTVFSTLSSSVSFYLGPVSPSSLCP